MRRVELVTEHGRNFVAVVEIPPFVSPRMPDAVTWGSRIFFREVRPDAAQRDSGDQWWYVEGFAVASLTPSPGLPREALAGDPPGAASETFRCKRRDEFPLAAAQFAGADRWKKVGPDRCCSYCGSLHPDDALEIALEAAKPESGNEVEFSDKHYKVYVRRAEVRNAMEGGIKFYAAHLPTDEVSQERLQKALREGHRASGARRRPPCDVPPSPSA